MLVRICVAVVISVLVLAPSVAQPQPASPDATPPRQDPAHPITQPSYPTASMAARQEGAVILNFVVREDGTVDPASIDVSESSGHTLLDSAAINEAATWRFIPASLGDKPVAARHQFRVAFEAQGQDCGVKIERKPNHPYKISQPPYPDAARSARQEGGVDLMFIVEADGFVNPCSIVVARSSGFPSLDQAAAREATFNWRFHPAMFRGQPVSSQHGFRVEFALKKSAGSSKIPGIP